MPKQPRPCPHEHCPLLAPHLPPPLAVILFLIAVFNAFFYTLVSTDTNEVFFSQKRRRYLVDQGYTYKVIPATPGLSRTVQHMQAASNIMRTRDEQRDILTGALRANIEADEAAELRTALGAAGDAGRAGITTSGRSIIDQLRLEQTGAAAALGSRYASQTMETMSGGSDLRYLEFSATHADRARVLEADPATLIEKQ